MILEKKVFLRFFLLSLIFHALIVFIVFTGEKGKKIQDREITWVSLQPYSLKGKEGSLAKSGGTDLGEGNKINEGKTPQIPEQRDTIRENKGKEAKSEDKKKPENKGKEVKSENKKKAKDELIQKSMRNRSHRELSSVSKKEIKQNEKNKKVSQSKKIGKGEKKTIVSAKQNQTKKQKSSKKEIFHEQYEQYAKLKKSDLNQEEDKHGRTMKGSGSKTKSDSIKEVAEIKIGSPTSSDDLDKKIEDLYKLYEKTGGSREVGGEINGGEQSQKPGYIDELRLVYIEVISSLIKNNYKIPQFLKGTRLSCVVYISISKDGNIEGLRIEQSSGNPSFDSFVLKTIQDSVPFPSPPESMKFLLRFSTYD